MEGIAASDFNNDGYTDLFFTGNMVSNELYINQGDLRFKVTNQSKLNSEVSGPLGCLLWI